ncbi:MAG: polysaccharide biosynthesis C-terminal domain-containing protein, partial [Actinomycetota bacterium]
YAVAAGAGLLMAQVYLLGRPLWPAVPTMEDLRQGLPFSLGGSAEKIRSGSDAFMLVRFDQPVEAGIYGAANRLMGAATAPIRALSHATNARAYEAGARSIGAVRRLTLRMAALAMAWAVPLGVVLALAGPWIVRPLPSDYAVAGTALQWMAVLPALLAIQMFGSTALTASGHQAIRVQLMLVTAVANVALNAVLIPAYGWRGAVAATIATTTAYGLGAWSVMTVLANRERRAPEVAGS